MRRLIAGLALVALAACVDTTAPYEPPQPDCTLDRFWMSNPQGEPIEVTVETCVYPPVIPHGGLP